MGMILIFCFGVAIGFIMSVIIIRPKAMGSLRIDTSDPDSPPYLFVELSCGIGDIANKKQVTFDVNVEDFIPPK